MENRLCSRQQQNTHEQQKEPHAPVVLLTQARGLIEDERDAQVGPKEKQQRKQQRKNEVPEGKLFEHAKDVSTEQHRDQNQALRAGTSSVEQAHSSDQKPTARERRDGENGNPCEQHEHPAGVNPRVSPEQANEGIISSELGGEERDEQGRIGDQRHGA